jgi:molybdopterin-dependent oxidoreductase alpha subunit
MARRRDKLTVTEPKTWAAGIPGVAGAMSDSLHEMGPARTLKTLRALNQRSGFDCPGCAWPEGPDHHIAEFCENGAKAVAEEATVRRIGPDFFKENSVDDLRERDGYWLGQQGRLTHPVIKREGSRHYERIEWDAAFDLIARELKALASPDEAVFYTSGRTSNEAAFAYQLFVREFGTNNLPDCSNMCHESSGSALSETIGIGKGSVLLEDLDKAELIIIAGQNPGTNHPRMLIALEKAKEHGARIVAVNPLPEAGLLRFKNPQRPKGIIGHGTQLADLFLQVKVNGDLALFQALNVLLLEAEDRLRRLRCGDAHVELGRRHRRDWARSRPDRGTRRARDALAQHRGVLGHGPNTTQELGPDHSRDRELPPAARKHWPTRRWRLPCARS